MRITGSQGNFRNLVVWSRSLELATQVYSLTESFPKAEQFGLQAQMRRAAASVPANIAEGSRRHHSAEFIQFLGVALGSLGELETFLELAWRLGYLDSIEAPTKEIGEICRMISGLRKRLAGQASGLTD